ncbi:melanopsin-A-like [Paramacrobiotus metropolitanus]|uniref:melanopsin-A-like n=1 Tax=Paramacrobiotus metropolitanus TaxID=2943436 RepID=UPI0024464693|nr:melanopsin-A-like [Paramacrobiotus metropolitanus]
MLCTPTLRTPFNVYLINLLVTNILQITLQVPLEISSALFSRWWMGWTACTVYLFANNVLIGVIMASHVLISVNRVWALTYHLHYKHHHTLRTAIQLCIFVWVWVHVIVVPGIVSDALYYRRPLDKFGCSINTSAQPKWALAKHFLGYILPLVAVILTFPYILGKQLLRKRVGVVGGGITQHITRNQIGIENSDNSVTESRKGKRSERLSKIWTRGTVLYVLMTVSLLATWTPGRVYFTIKLFINVDNASVFQICYVLFALQSVFDPVLFAIALKELRPFGCRMSVH